MSKITETPEHKTMIEEELNRERWELLQHVDEITEKPIIALAFVWIVLLIVDFTSGLSPLLQTLTYVIWVLFFVDFAIELWIAPVKSSYLRRNWLTALSLALPALRVFRIFRGLRALRAVRTIRTVNFLRLVTSVNRSLRSTGAVLGRHKIGYLLAITIIVIFTAGAAMAAFESPADVGLDGPQTTGRTELNTYTEAVWWSASVIATVETTYRPKTAEGRIINLLLSIYALGVFSYFTATVASYFIGSERRRVREEQTNLQHEIQELRMQLTEFAVLLENSAGHGGAD